jgi:hypothetical protein
MGAVFRFLPLLALPIIIYNLMALFFVGTGAHARSVDQASMAASAALEAGLPAPVVLSPMIERLTAAAFEIPMVSGAVWTVSSGDLILLLGLFCLFLEIVKSANTGAATILNHSISMLLFVGCLIQFLLLDNFATSVFFLLVVMTLLDTLAGVIVTIMAARRDIDVAGYGD